MESINCQLVSWEDIENWTRTLARDIKESGYNPDVVIGLTRGGWVPSRILCDHLVCKNLYAVKTEHWGLTATRDGAAKLAQGLGVDVKGQRVLIVDDITDTGQSITLATDHVKEQEPEEVRTATLLHITHSSFTPDYFAEEIRQDKWAWFIFPWNFNEDIQSLVRKTLDDARAAEEIKNMLIKHCQIKVDDDVLYNTLIEMAKTEAIEETDGKWIRKEGNQ